MRETCICDYCEEDFKTIKIKKEPLKNLCPNCKKDILGKRCLNCRDPINTDEDFSEPWNYYCGYCESVILGKPNASWLPSIAKDEIDKKGFHKI